MQIINIINNNKLMNSTTSLKSLLSNSSKATLSPPDSEQAQDQLSPESPESADIDDESAADKI